LLKTDIKDNHWFWDTELLIRAQEEGLRVAEFPVDWVSRGDTKVDLVRDIFGMGSQILRMWWALFVNPRITHRRTIGAGSLLTLVALGLMTLYIDPMRILNAVQGADVTPVVIATLVYVASWPLRGLRYRDILAELGYYERTGFLTGAILISQTANLVFPARAGDAVRAYVLKVRRRIPYPSGFGSLVVERVFDLITITSISGSILVGLVVIGGANDLAAAISEGVPQVPPEAIRTAVTVAAGVGLAAIIAVAATVLSARSDRNLIRATVLRVNSDSYTDYLASNVEQLVGGMQTVIRDGNAFIRISVNSLAIWTIDVITAILILGAFRGTLDAGLDLPVLIVASLFAVSIGNLAKVLPLSPGGIGLYEAAFAAFIVALTPIAAPVAFAAAVLDHAVKNLVTIIGGIVSMLVLNISLTTAVEEGKATEKTEAGD
jgi:uncharacterized protein (TIRG00374 family)